MTSERRTRGQTHLVSVIVWFSWRVRCSQHCYGESCRLFAVGHTVTLRMMRRCVLMLSPNIPPRHSPHNRRRMRRGGWRFLSIPRLRTSPPLLTSPVVIA